MKYIPNFHCFLGKSCKTTPDEGEEAPGMLIRGMRKFSILFLQFEVEWKIMGVLRIDYCEKEPFCATHNDICCITI